MSKRTPLEQRMFDEGKADGAAGRPSTPPQAGGALERAYAQGYTAGSESRPAPAKKTGATKKAGTKKAPAKKTSSSRRSSTGSRAATRARKATTAPVGRIVARQTTSALGALGLAMAIALLYNFLTNAEKVEGFLGGIARAVQWLDDPTTSIPYRR